MIYHTCCFQAHRPVKILSFSHSLLFFPRCCCCFFYYNFSERAKAFFIPFRFEQHVILHIVSLIFRADSTFTAYTIYTLSHTFLQIHLVYYVMQLEIYVYKNYTKPPSIHHTMDG